MQGSYILISSPLMTFPHKRSFNYHHYVHCRSICCLTGIDKGVKLLSEINISVALVLMLFVLCAGPTLLLLNTMVENFGYYLITYFRAKLLYIYLYTRNPSMVLQLDHTILGLVVILGTICGHVHCAYFKGRTIREFIFGVLIIPTVFYYRLVYYLW